MQLGGIDRFPVGSEVGLLGAVRVGDGLEHTVQAVSGGLLASDFLVAKAVHNTFCADRGIESVKVLAADHGKWNSAASALVTLIY